LGGALFGKAPRRTVPLHGRALSQKVFPLVGGCQMGSVPSERGCLSMWSSLVVGVGELSVGDESTEREEGRGRGEWRGGE
jgi:hypothetical protein